jgi:signal recognition particle receptor subunit beta
MALVNHAKGEINAKIVYFGPANSGKETNLNHVYRKIKQEHRGQMKSMNVESNRMLFFDFSPAGHNKIGDYNVRFHVYSIVGEASGDTAWKMILKGVDGIVFVADSARERMADNIAGLDQLRKIARSYGISIKDLPGILQCNKRDIASPLSVSEMETALNYGGYKVIPAVAGNGEGVLESISALVKGVLKSIKESGMVPGLETGEPAPTAPPEEPQPFIPPTVTVQEETVVVSSPPEPEAVAPEPSIQLSGEPEALSGGRIRLPLRISCGNSEKIVSLTISITAGLE